MSFANIVTIKKQVPKINRVTKRVEVEEIISNPVPNYIYQEIEHEEIREVPEERIVEVEKENITYKPREIIVEEQVINTRVVNKTIEVPVEKERFVDSNTSIPVPFTLDRHIEHTIVQPYDEKVEYDTQQVPKHFEVQRFDEHINNYEIPVYVTRIEEDVHTYETYTEAPKRFNVTHFTESEQIVPVDKFVDVAIDVQQDKPFQIDNFAEEIVVVDKIIPKPVEQIVDVQQEKTFDIVAHGEVVVDQVDEVPITVKIFEENTVPQEVLEPHFAHAAVTVPTFHPEAVNCKELYAYKETYQEHTKEVDVIYDQYSISEEPVKVDVNVSVYKLVEVPVNVENVVEKTYPIETIVEVPQEKIVPKRVTIKTYVEKPKVNKIYKDKIIEKFVDLRREIVNPIFVERIEEENKPLPVDLRTVQGVVKIQEQHRDLQLNSYKKCQTIPQQQKADFETVARQLSELQFQQGCLSKKIEFAQQIDRSILGGDASAYEQQLGAITQEIGQLRGAISTLSQTRDGLREKVQIVPTVDWQETIDDSHLSQLQRDIEKTRSLNAQLTAFITRYEAHLRERGVGVPAEVTENKSFLVTIPQQPAQQLTYVLAPVAAPAVTQQPVQITGSQNIPATFTIRSSEPLGNQVYFGGAAQTQNYISVNQYGHAGQIQNNTVLVASRIILLNI